MLTDRGGQAVGSGLHLPELESLRLGLSGVLGAPWEGSLSLDDVWGRVVRESVYCGVVQCLAEIQG